MARKNSQLVCQYLENVSRQMLEDFQNIIRDHVRGRNGIYALYRKNGDLYYVGLASSLFTRLKQHLHDHHGNTWDRFSVYLTIGPQYMKEIESVLIRIAQPPGNKIRGKFSRCENILRRIRAEYRKRKKQEESTLFGISKHSPKPAASEKLVKNGKREGRMPVLAQYIDRGMKLRADFKGKRIRARILCDGRVSFKGKKFTSPSVAAAAAVRRRSCNGWRFWKYERAPGDWVFLNALRR